MNKVVGGQQPSSLAETIADQIVSVFGYAKILDVGCGTGDLVFELVNRGIDT